MDVVFAVIGVVVVGASLFSMYAFWRAARVHAEMTRTVEKMQEVLERRG